MGLAAAELIQSRSIFEGHFTRGLEQMLTPNGLGALILVLANATQQPALWAEFNRPLRQLFEQHAEWIRRALLAGRTLAATDDDLAVFLKLMVLGYESIRPTTTRTAEGWELQFNPLRALRPPRTAQQRLTTNWAPFNPEGFHFNRPFLRQESFWQGELAGRVVELFYNKFPFMDHHLLLVPEREHSAPQFLTEGDHLFIWQLAEQLEPTLEGIGIGYNSYGGYASVNHLHAQLFIRPQPLPIERHHWLHNGGERPYPLPIETFTAAAPAWERLNELNQSGQSYNLLYRAGRLYLMPRRLQGSVPLPSWSVGTTWYELAGGTLCFNRDDYQLLTADDIATELASLTPTA